METKLQQPLPNNNTSINGDPSEDNQDRSFSNSSSDKHVVISIPSSPSSRSNDLLERYKGVFVAIIYGLVSMCAVLINKAVLSSWNFQFPLTMIACQMIISYILLISLKRASLIEFDDWSLETARKVAPMALAHVGNVLLGLAALNLVDIPMFGALRRTGVIFVLGMEYIVLGKKSSYQVLSSTLLLLAGAVVGGWGDLNFDPFGYGLTFFVNITTALSLVLIPKLGSEAKLNAFGLMQYQITVSFPIVVLCIIGTNEMQGVLAYPSLWNPAFQVAFFVSSAQIFLVNYTLFLCTQLNSALTTTVTGTVKNIGETMLGFVFFSVPMAPLNLLGIFIGFLGSVAYTLVKYLEQQAQPKKPAP